MKKVLLFSLAFVLIFLFYACTGTPADGDGDTTGTTEFTISDFDGTSKTEAEALVTTNSSDPAGNAALAVFETEEFISTYVKDFSSDFSDAATYVNNITEAASELSYIFGGKVYTNYTDPQDDIETQITIIFDNIENIKNLLSTTEIANYLASISSRLSKIVNQTDINIIIEKDPAGHFMNLALLNTLQNMKSMKKGISDTTSYVPAAGLGLDYRDFMMFKCFVDSIIYLLDEQIFTDTNKAMIIEFVQIAYGFEYSDYTEMQNYYDTFTTTYVRDEFLDDLVYLLNEYSDTGELEAIYDLTNSATPTLSALESDFSVIYNRIAPNDSDSSKLNMKDILNDNMVYTPDFSNIVSMLDMLLENYHKMVQFEAMSRYQNRERLNFMEANMSMMDIMESSSATPTLEKQTFRITELRQMEINNEEHVRFNGTLIGDMGDIIDILRSVLPSGTLTITNNDVILVGDDVDQILLGDISLAINFGTFSDGTDIADLNLAALSGIETPLATLIMMEPYDGTTVNSNFVPELKNLIDKVNGVDYTGEDLDVEITFGSDLIFNMYIYDLLNDTTIKDIFDYNTP